MPAVWLGIRIAQAAPALQLSALAKKIVAVLNLDRSQSPANLAAAIKPAKAEKPNAAVERSECRMVFKKTPLQSLAKVFRIMKTKAKTPSGSNSFVGQAKAAPFLTPLSALADKRNGITSKARQRLKERLHHPMDIGGSHSEERGG